MPQSLNHYLALPYTMVIIPDSEDGGYVACIAELAGCLTQADTWEELLPMIEDAKRLWLEDALADGDIIPEPVNRIVSG